MKLKKYREITERASTGEVFTPSELVREKLSKLDESVFISDSTTFFVPGCGLGVYLEETVKKLMEYGHSEENAKSRVIGIDIRVKYINLLKLSGYRVFLVDFLSEEFDQLIETEFGKNMKFDVVLGNPPYSTSSDSDSIKLWSQFSEKSYELLADGGSLSFVTPTQILFSTRASIKANKPTTRIQKILEENEFVYYDETVDDYFSVAVPICSWSLIKSPSKSPTRIILKDGTICDVDYKVNFNIKKTTFDSILDKVVYKNNIKKYKRYRTLYTNIDLSDNYNDLYKFKVHWNSKNSKYKYIKNRIDVRYKLCINNFKLFDISEDNLFITSDDVSHAYFYITATEAELVKIQKIWSKKLFKYLAEKWKNSKGVYMIAQLQGVIPILDTSVEWTDDKLYNFFGLTQEEINEIEENVK